MLVSMATDNSHRVMMKKKVSSHFFIVFDQFLFLLAGYDDIHKSLNEIRNLDGYEHGLRR